MTAPGSIGRYRVEAEVGRGTMGIVYPGTARCARRAATFRPDSSRTLDIDVPRILDELTLELR